MNLTLEGLYGLSMGDDSSTPSLLPFPTSDLTSDELAMLVQYSAQGNSDPLSPEYTQAYFDASGNLILPGSGNYTVIPASGGAATQITGAPPTPAAVSPTGVPYTGSVYGAGQGTAVQTGQSLPTPAATTTTSNTPIILAGAAVALLALMLLTEMGH